MTNEWIARLLNQGAKLKLADRATQVMQGQRRASLVNRLVRLTQDRALGVSPMSSPPEPDDMIQIDSPTTNHYHPPAASTNNGWLRLFSAALLATGIGGPLALAAWKLPEVIAALRPSPPVDAPRDAEDPSEWFDLYVGPPEDQR